MFDCAKASSRSACAVWSEDGAERWFTTARRMPWAGGLGQCAVVCPVARRSAQCAMFNAFGGRTVMSAMLISEGCVTTNRTARATCLGSLKRSPRVSET